MVERKCHPLNYRRRSRRKRSMEEIKMKEDNKN
jgi:hypothetical protein